MKKLHVKKGDTVLIISGEDRGKQGQGPGSQPQRGQSHCRGPQHGEKACEAPQNGRPGGIIDAEGAMYASKVMVICPHCNKPTRVGHKKFADGTKARICKRCGETL